MYVTLNRKRSGVFETWSYYWSSVVYLFEGQKEMRICCIFQELANQISVGAHTVEQRVFRRIVASSEVDQEEHRHKNSHPNFQNNHWPVNAKYYEYEWT